MRTAHHKLLHDGRRERQIRIAGRDEWHQRFAFFPAKGREKVVDFGHRTSRI